MTLLQGVFAGWLVRAGRCAIHKSAVPATQPRLQSCGNLKAGNFFGRRSLSTRLLTTHAQISGQYVRNDAEDALALVYADLDELASRKGRDVGAAEAEYQERDKGPVRSRTPLPKAAQPLEVPRLGFFASLAQRKILDHLDMWDMDADEVWERWQLLPGDRVRVVSREALTQILIAVRNQAGSPVTQRVALRYLSVFEAMLEHEDIVPTIGEFNRAIICAGRGLRRAPAADFDRALAFADRLERTHGPLELVTYNILLDIALRTRGAGFRQHAVKQVLERMRQNNVAFDKYTYTALMRWAGEKGKKRTVKALYSRFASEGVVDTVVANCLLVSLLRAGDVKGAERVYKALMAGTPIIATRLLNSFIEDESHVAYTTDLRPDAASFNPLLRYYCRIGNHTRVRELLVDMEAHGVNEDNATFVSLMSAFGEHGRSAAMNEVFTTRRQVLASVSGEVSPVRSSHWTLDRLERVFEGMLARQDIVFNRQLVRAALTAFSRCADSSERVTEAWEQMDEVWRVREGGTLDSRSLSLMQELAYRQRISHGRARRAQHELVKAEERLARVKHIRGSRDGNPAEARLSHIESSHVEDLPDCRTAVADS
ncbi:hypothetical protein PYCC9005_001365 [Savitreella phatthalungensis]